jgi:hypothetical protein
MRARLEDTFLEEQGNTGPVTLRPAINLGDGYVEAVPIDTDGEETTAKRILFP